MDDTRQFRITSDHDTMVVTFLEPHLSREEELKTVFGQLKDQLDHLDLTYVVLDFRAVTFVSSSLLGQLVALKKFLDEREGRFRIAQVNDDIKDTLRITRLDEWIDIDDTLEQATQALHEAREQSGRQRRAPR